MTDPYLQHEPGDHDIGRLVQHAYGVSVDIETASRHLWRFHRVAATPQVRGVRRALVSTLAAVLLFAMAGGAVALSTSAMPGDSLYSVKRGAERLHLMVSFAPDSDARLHLRFARSRIEEVRTVAATRPDMVPDLLSELVAAVDRAVAVGGSDLAEEVAVVRVEASSTLTALGQEHDAELAGPVDDTLRAIGSETLAAAEPEQGQPAGEDEPAPDPADAAADPVGAGHERMPAPDRSAAPPVGQAEPAVEEHAVPEGPDGGDTAEPVQDDAGVAAPAEGTGEDAPAGAVADGPELADDATADPPPAPSPDTAPAEVAADGTMPTLERLEGLLRRP